jgi:hypothetical protein
MYLYSLKINGIKKKEKIIFYEDLGVLKERRRLVLPRASCLKVRKVQ